MEIITISFIVILNLAAIACLYKILGRIEINNKMVIIGICLIAMYSILFVIYSLSTIGMDGNIANTSRQVVLFTFLPVNVILGIVPSIIQIMKLKDKLLEKEKFQKRLIICLVLAVILLIVDYVYMKDIQIGIANFKTN